MLSGWYCLIPHELDPDRFGIFRKFYEKDFLSISKYNGKAFSFCNTENKSYDLMVQACLILYKHYFPSVEIDSDGNEKYWLEAKFFVHKITGIETLPEHFKLEQKINDFYKELVCKKCCYTLDYTSNKRTHLWRRPRQ